jgi:hypothetical protein
VKPLLTFAPRAAALLAALVLCGGHWMIAQSIAWSAMLVTYSQETTVLAAIDNTFDGAHPCELCKTVSKGVAEGKDGDGFTTSTVKAEFQCLTFSASSPLHPPRAFSLLPVTETHASAVRFAPPTPPPRAA